MINNYVKILIIVGHGTDVVIAINDLNRQLNELEARYETIGAMCVTIDKEITTVSRNIQVFAIQMLGRTQTI